MSGTRGKKMIDVYIWIFVWSVILIMLIISLMKIENEIAEDRINKMFEYLEKRKGERMELAKARYVNVYKLMEFANNMKDKSIDANDIARFPWANVRENIHGKWIVDEDGNIECSVCGHNGVGDLYCERCGAQMDEEEVNIYKMIAHLEALGTPEDK